MKTIFEKTFPGASLAEKAAEKEFGTNWAKKYQIVKLDTGRSAITKKAKGDKPAKPAKVDPRTLSACPECGSTELYVGRNVEGLVIDEDKCGGCHHCDWAYGPKEPKVRMADRLNTARKGYVSTQAYSGNISADTGDEVAEALRGLSPEQVCAVADLVKKADDGFYLARYARLNIGQRRMNAGNVIRKAFHDGAVTIGFIKNAAASVH